MKAGTLPPRQKCLTPAIRFARGRESREVAARLAEETVPGLRGLDGKAAYSKLERRYGDLLAALQWIIDEGRTDEALRLASWLAPFWMTTKRATPLVIAGLAAVSAQRGELDRAATLVGAAEAVMDAQGFAWPPDERPHHERIVAIISSSNDADELERVRSAGRAMTPGVAIDFALGSRS